MTYEEATNYCNAQGKTLTYEISETARLEFRYFGIGSFWVSQKNGDKCMMNNHNNELGAKVVDWTTNVNTCFLYADVVCEKDA